ncbi:MAG: hypothetical protein U0Z26_08120 [Anaerolineales bacterium]
MQKRTKIIIGIIVGILVLICICGIVFIQSSNTPEAQATTLARYTAEAAQATTDANQAADAAVTSTAEAQLLQARMDNAEVVFEDTFDENSPFLRKISATDSYYMRDGTPEFSPAFTNYHLYPVGINVSDFIAELDCKPTSGEAYCGIAFAVKQIDPQVSFPDFFYAAYLASSGRCGTDDLTGSYSVSKSATCTVSSTSGNSLFDRLRIERIGQHVKIYKNGELVKEVTLDNPEAASGDIGLYFGTTSNEGISSLEVDNLKIWAVK